MGYVRITFEIITSLLQQPTSFAAFFQDYEETLFSTIHGAEDDQVLPCVQGGRMT